MDLACGIGPDGQWWGRVVLSVDAAALRRLGLHAEQPSAVLADPPPPGWWGRW
ncbi:MULTISPECIES: hypothetical protein [Kitasatospora]|uniref:Uncharacterized protein n=1 Tax=Kitasatospora setae (strain ATCC 33774 / DSM 43861 / JCM 3304 / KCC A-0304 / NBRC 14216 / KM-6054) TaxID=452652 RepID=E4N4P6_KITSK|nr:MULTISPECIES: hypothetical protein [Kitasatospora]BAJ26177.1 hypothetical protein KSE_03300 [Kitasatospora setae KM-6054]